MTESEQSTPETEALPEETQAAEIFEENPLQAQLVKALEEVATLKDAYLRAAAETENVRARAKREQEDTAKYATTRFARDMVNVLENLGRAAQSISPEARAENPVLKNVGDGIDMSMNELLGIFERHGIKRINPVGEKFDHNFHQAVSQVDSPDHEPGTVVQVLQAGYQLHDRLLRPAMVTVAAAQNAAPKVNTVA